MSREPLIIIGAVVAGLQVANLELVHPPAWLHVAIAVAIAVLGALRARQLVSPVTTQSPELDE